MQASHAAPKPLEGGALALLTLALAMATFMQVLDTTIANVAIPTIAGNLGASSSQGTWVITSFGVANAISLPLTGWLAKRVGEVKLFLWSITLFVLASWLCGLSSSLELLILFRVIQGAVAGPIVPLSQSLLLSNYPPQKRSLALSLWSMTVIVAPIFGPILGGWISDNYHWGWIFFINVPVGILVFSLSRRLLKDRETATERKPIDGVGLMLLVLGIGALQLMLDRGKELDWFSSTEVITLAVVAVMGISLLIAWALTDENPIVDLSLFKHRNFAIGVGCISLAYLLYFGTVVLLPQLLQSYLGYTATWAGIASAVVGILPVFLSPIIGKNAHRLDMRMLVTISFLVYAACFYARTQFTVQMDIWAVVWPQFWQGVAVACFFMPLTAIAFAGLKPHQLASAASLSNFLRTLSGSVGTSLISALWDRREAVHHETLTQAINGYNPVSVQAMDTLQGLGMSQAQSGAYLAQEITRQTHVMGSNEIFALSACLFIVMTAVVWLAKPPFHAGGGGGEH
ncbi:DHA2 family efflux MFS transporter permease subunit [Pseudaeromonas paramecii]|uniref:Multidrug efflux MFS transporter permease subunit EmrB n=1 Tax=Pseudaeromonas paramecii TaxID=2138166 RepID=A0ABP8QHX0_9GAMM